MGERLTFSIVINTLNRASHLRVALESLRLLRHPQFEVIVVNGPSTDDTETVMRDYADLIRLGRVDEANLSKSRNVGIAMARGDVVCFLDDDATPEPDWLDQLERVYLSDSQVGAAGGFIRDHTGVEFQSRVLVCDRYGDSEGFSSFEEAGEIDVSPGAWRYFSQTGCNSSFRRDALVELGGFDEEFAYFLDETDVNLRMRDAGWTVTLEPQAEVHHKYAPSHLRDHKRVPARLYLPLRSKAYFALRHARSHKSLPEVFDKLSTHATEIHGYNKWYIDNDVISQDHYDQLTKDVNTGLLDGIRDAFSQTQPALLSEETKSEFADERFKAFPVRLPARQRLRICYLSQEYPPAQCGGIGVWTHLMARSLADLGHEVTVITRSESGQHTVDFEDGVWVHRIVPQYQPTRSQPDLGDLPQIIKDYAYTAYDEVVRTHLRRGLDLVSAPIWDLEGAAVLASGILPTVVSLHTTAELALPFKPDWHNNAAYRRNHVDKVIAGERHQLATAPVLMANSNAILDDLSALQPAANLKARASVIPHGMGPSPVALSRQADPKKPVKGLFVGRLEPRKGADLLLEVLPEIMEAHQDLEFDLIGDDTFLVHGTTLREQFTSKHSNAPWLSRVRFRGFVDEQTRDQAFLDCDFFVAPSRYESFGLVFLEAMRAGKPSIGAAVGGIQEVIEDGVSGMLPPPGDAEALHDALHRMLSDSRVREQLGKAARQCFESQFDQAQVAELAQSYYLSVLRSWSPAPVSAQAV